MLGEWALRVQGLTCKWTGSRAVRSQGALAGCSLSLRLVSAYFWYCAVFAGKYPYYYRQGSLLLLRPCPVPVPGYGRRDCDGKTRSHLQRPNLKRTTVDTDYPQHNGSLELQ